MPQPRIALDATMAVFVHDTQGMQASVKTVAQMGHPYKDVADKFQHEYIGSCTASDCELHNHIKNYVLLLQFQHHPTTLHSSLGSLWPL